MACRRGDVQEALDAEDATLDALAARFGVSGVAMAWRVHNLGLGPRPQPPADA